MSIIVKILIGFFVFILICGLSCGGCIMSINNRNNNITGLRCELLNHGTGGIEGVRAAGFCQCAIKPGHIIAKHLGCCIRSQDRTEIISRRGSGWRVIDRCTGCIQQENIFVMVSGLKFRQPCVH